MFKNQKSHTVRLRERNTDKQINLLIKIKNK